MTYVRDTGRTNTRAPKKKPKPVLNPAVRSGQAQAQERKLNPGVRASRVKQQARSVPAKGPMAPPGAQVARREGAKTLEPYPKAQKGSGLSLKGLLHTIAHDVYGAGSGHGKSRLATSRRGGSVGAASVTGVVRSPVFKNTGKDVLDLPRSAVQGAYETGAAGLEAAHGRTARAKRLGQAVVGGFGGEGIQGLAALALGDKKRASEHFRKAGRSAEAHPLYAALDLAGAYGAAGRTAGAAARSGALGTTVRRAASTRRADLVLVPGARRTIKRSYSRNLITQGVQKAAEKSKVKRGLDPNLAEPAQRRRLLRSEADEAVSQVEAQRRVGREQARRGVRKATKKLSRPERGIVHPAVERRIRPGHIAEDLTKIRQRLDAEYGNPQTYARMNSSQRRGNRQQVKAIDTALKAHAQGKLSEERLLAAAQGLIEQTRQTSGRLVAQNVLAADQEAAAVARPYAIEHMGARHESTLPPGSNTPSRRAVGEARAEERVAKQRVREADTQVARETQRRDQMVGRHRVHAAADARKLAQGKLSPFVALRRDAERGRLSSDDGMIGQAQRRVDHAASEAKQARVALKEARQKRRAVRPKQSTMGLVGPNGERISTADVLQHMRATGTPEAGFLTHRAGATGSRAYFQNFLPSRRTSGQGRRTGEATRLGTHDISPQAIEGSVVGARGLADAVESFDHFARDFTVKSPKGGLWSGPEAERYLDAYTNTRGVRDASHEELVPIRVGSASYSPKRLAEIEAAQASGIAPDLTGLVEEKVASMLNDPLGSGARNVALVPRSAWDRFIKHQVHQSSTPAKAGQKFTGIFRSTVLPFSTKWLTGNLAEGVLRSGIAGITPLDVLQGRRLARLVKHLDDSAGGAFDARLRGGLLYGSSDRLGIHRDRLAFEDTVLEKPAAVGGALLHAPVVRHVLAGVDGFQRGVFALNKSAERLFQDGVIGKQARRDIQELTGSWTKAVRFQRQAMEDVAQGLRDTPAQVRYARAIDETLGKYTRFSPTLRRTTQTIAPFLPWYINSARFVYHTLPVKHPVKAALLANAERAIAQDVEAQRKNVPPGDLGSAIKTKSGGYLPLARYTPFGAFTGELPEAALDPLLPQFASVWEIMHGRSWTGRPLQIPGEKRGHVSGGQKALLALYAGAESVLPGLAIARRLREHGETPQDTSTVFAPRTKKGTSYGSSAIERVFNPLRPVYLKKPRRPGSAPAAKTDPVTAARRHVAQSQGAADILDDPAVQAARRAAAKR